MIYQLRDDILDVIATDNELGKPAGQDLAEGIYNLPTIFALRDPLVGEELRGVLGAVLDDEDRERARKLVVATDGIERTIASAQTYLAQAHVALDERCPSQQLRDGFASLIESLLEDLPSLLVDERLERREGDHLSDVRLVGDQHGQSIDAETESGRRRQSPLQRLDVILVDVHRLGLALGGQSGLVLEAGALVERVDQFRESVGEFASDGVGLEALDEVGVALVAARERRDLDRESPSRRSDSTATLSQVASNSSARHRPGPQARCTSTPRSASIDANFSRGVWTDTSSPTASLASSAIVRRGQGAAKENGRPWYSTSVVPSTSIATPAVNSSVKFIMSS